MGALIQRCSSGTSLCKRCTSGTSLLRRCQPCPPCTCLTAETLNVTFSDIVSCFEICFDLGFGERFDLLDGDLNGSFILSCDPANACWWRTEFGSVRKRSWAATDCTGDPVTDETDSLWITAHLWYSLGVPRCDVRLGWGGVPPDLAFSGGLVGVPGQTCSDLLGATIDNTLIACGTGGTSGELGYDGTAIVSL